MRMMNDRSSRDRCVLEVSGGGVEGASLTRRKMLQEERPSRRVVFRVAQSPTVVNTIAGELVPAWHAPCRRANSQFCTLNCTCG